MFVVGYFIKKAAKGDKFMVAKLRGNTSINCVAITKKTDYIAAGSVCGNIFLIKINEKSLEVIKKMDQVTEKPIMSIKFTNYFLGVTVFDIS